MDFELLLIDDAILREWKEACRVDASTQWHHVLSYLSGYKTALLSYSVSPLTHARVETLHFLWSIALHRSNMSEHVFRRN